MILIEHAVVLTMDAAGSIFLDGSVPEWPLIA